MGAVSVIGPDGAVGEAIDRALLAPWVARGGQARYTGAGTPAQALRSLAALREHAPADLVILDTHMADQGLSRGLVVRVPADSVPGVADLSQLGREAARVCTPIGFDALALSYQPASIRPAPRGLEILADAPLRDRLALPAPTETLGAYLVALLARRETGDWHLTDAGVRQLRALRGDNLALAARDPAPTEGVATPAQVAVMWNSKAQLARDAVAAADRPGVLIPAEGTILRPLLLCLSASAPHLRGALSLIDFALRPESQAALAASLHVAPARAGVVLPSPVQARVPDLGTVGSLLLPDAGFINRLRGTLAGVSSETAGSEAHARN
jgi:putative spermidine/putrescine transport system substrate-binding protein